jgi:hypothetical protein
MALRKNITFYRFKSVFNKVRARDSLGVGELAEPPKHLKNTNLFRKKIGFFILAVLAFPVTLWAANLKEQPGPGLRASLDRDAVRVGGIVSLTLKYQLPEGASLPKKLEIKGFKDFTIIKRSVEEDQIRIKFLVDQLGSWKTDPITLAYLDREGKAQHLKTDPVSITVLSNLGEKPEEARLKPIQDIMPTKSRWLKYLPWAAGLMGLLLIVLGLVVWWTQRMRKKNHFKASQVPPHVRAKKEIVDLEAQRLFEKGDIKGFYFRFSEIMRHYLESIRGFPAAEFTTEEIASYVDNDQDRALLPILRQADLVKFADTVPTQAGKEEAVQRALSYIQETSPRPENSYSGESRGGSVQ